MHLGRGHHQLKASPQRTTATDRSPAIDLELQLINRYLPCQIHMMIKIQRAFRPPSQITE